MLIMDDNRTYDVPDLCRMLQALAKAGDHVEIYGSEDDSDWGENDEGFTILLSLQARLLDRTYDRFEASLVYYGMDTTTGCQNWRCFIKAIRPEKV